jgi:ADP-ribose pyrophosphatase
MWKRIEPTKTTKVGWRTITTKTFTAPDGKTTTYDIVYPDGQLFACVIAVTKDRKVIVAREFCPGPELTMDELPGGYVDAGEDIETAARREFQEETGYVPGTLKYLGGFHKDKYLNATWHAFLATDCVKSVEQKLEEEEFIEVVELPVEEFLKNAKNDKMTDHAAVLLAYDELINML